MNLKEEILNLKKDTHVSKRELLELVEATYFDSFYYLDIDEWENFKTEHGQYIAICSDTGDKTPVSGTVAMYIARQKNEHIVDKLKKLCDVFGENNVTKAINNIYE